RFIARGATGARAVDALAVACRLIATREVRAVGMIVTSKLQLGALGKQALATMAAAAVKRCTAALGFPAGAKAKLLPAAALGRLISAFHGKLGRAGAGPATAQPEWRGRGR